MYTARTTRIISKLWNFSLLTLSGVKPSVSGTDQTDDMPISCKTLDMHTTTSTERREKIKPHKLMLYGYLQTKCKFYSMIMYSKDNSCGWCWMFGALSHSRKKKDKRALYLALCQLKIAEAQSWITLCLTFCITFLVLCPHLRCCMSSSSSFSHFIPSIHTMQKKYRIFSFYVGRFF